LAEVMVGSLARVMSTDPTAEPLAKRIN
jgi:hypothetical protein